MEEKKKDLQKRIDANKSWIEDFEESGSAGSFEAQYKVLLEQITGIYKSAKEFHSQVSMVEHRGVRKWAYSCPPAGDRG